MVWWFSHLIYDSCYSYPATGTSTVKERSQTVVVDLPTDQDPPSYITLPLDHQSQIENVNPHTVEGGAQYIAEKDKTELSGTETVESGI